MFQLTGTQLGGREENQLNIYKHVIAMKKIVHVLKIIRSIKLLTQLNNDTGL